MTKANLEFDQQEHDAGAEGVDAIRVPEASRCEASAFDGAQEIDGMTERKVRLRLNQQQLELIDNTVKAGEAASREDLIRRALREFAAAHADTGSPTKS